MHSAPTVRAYRPGDFNALLEMKNLSAVFSPNAGAMSAEGLAHMLERPGYSPNDDLFIAEEDGRAVGFLDITLEPYIERAMVECFVRPGNRRHHAAADLFRAALARTRAAGVPHIQVNVRQGMRRARRILTKCGFAEMRRHYELAVPTAAVPTPSPRHDINIRRARPDDLPGLLETQNLAFQGAWDYQPNTLKEIEYFYRPDLQGVFVAMDGDTVAGYSRSTVQSNRRGERWGRLNMLGVRPDYQGRGLGRELVLVAADYIRSLGLEQTQLTVDASNTTALRLYRSLGFRRRLTSLWYEKPVC